MFIAASRLLVSLITTIGVSLIASCTSVPPAQTDRMLIDSMARSDIVLIGELHDNVAQHRLRLEWLRLLADRAPITIVAEHFDVQAQPRLDQARLALESSNLTVPERARRLAEAADFRFDGWDWTLIGPVVEFALERNLPLRAANLSAREAYAIARGDSHRLAGGVPAGWGADAEMTLSASIREGHCGVLPESMIPAMARAQRARDAQMAEVILAARESGRKVVLLAGNGHVRRDMGVSLHLQGRVGDATILSVGLLEREATSESGVFDRTRITEAQARPDPCESLRARFGAKAPPR